MALSGTIDFRLTAGEIISRALQRIGVLGQGMTASADEYEDAQYTLNEMLKTWSMEGPNLWGVAEQTVTLITTQQTYTLSPRPRLVMNARMVQSGVETMPLSEWNRQDWDNFPMKTSIGTPMKYVLDKQRENTTITLWPVPVFGTPGSWTVKVGYERALEIVTAPSQDVDVPEEFMETVIMCLAARLADSYQLENVTVERVRQRASLLYEQAMMYDRTGEVRFVLRRQ